MRRPKLPKPRLPRPRLPHPSAPAPLARLAGAVDSAARALARVVVAAVRAFARALDAGTKAVADRWHLLDVYARRRLAVIAALAAAIVAFALAAVPALPCQFPGGERCLQADDAIELVPADALAYAHVDMDRSSDQYRAASALARLLPMISRQVVVRLETGLPVSGAAGLEPGGEPARWLGGELAAAVVPAGGELTTVELLAVADQPAAQRRARSLPAAGGTTQYRGIELRSAAKVSTAMVHGFLVAGSAAGVMRVIDVATGVDGSPALADDADAREARASLPDPRFADAYFSSAGLASLMSGPHGPVTALAPLFAPGASRGATIAAVASDGALELRTQSLLDPALAKKQTGTLATLPGFAPTLASELPAESLAYVGVGQATGPLRRALAGSAGILGSAARLLGGIKPAQLAVLARRLAPALGPEAALAVAPPVLTAGVATEPPQLQFVAGGVDVKRAKPALAGLDRAPPNELSGERLLMASAPAALAALKDPKATLDASPSFAEATRGLPATPSLEAYLDLSGLRPLFETAGLAGNPAYASFAGEIRRLQALGVAIESGSDTLGVDLRLVVAGD